MGCRASSGGFLLVDFVVAITLASGRDKLEFVRVIGLRQTRRY